MSVDERSRLQLAEAAKRLLGDGEGITLMELLPPVGWADVATKTDLLQLEYRMDLRFEAVDLRFELLEQRLVGRFEHGLRIVVVTMMSLSITGFVATILAVALTR
jgi:hypothetical protein